MKKLGTYSCDTASLVINGVRISNGIGDGCYNIYYFENKEEAEKIGFKEISSSFWIDLRKNTAEIWTDDCDVDCDKIIIAQDTIDAKALRIFKNAYGDMALVKYF